VVAGMRDKALAENLRILAPVARGLRILLLPGHPRAATRAEWTQAVDAAGLDVLEWLEPGQVEGLGLAGEGSGEPWLVTGSFLAVGAWLGARRASPGL